MILNMTSGGSTGCVLTVTAPAGAVVTASKDGKTLTKTAVSGTAVFRGLEGGEWSVTCTDVEQTSVPQTVTVKNDYAAELTFFSATIHVTYPEGSTCTASDGVTTLTAPDKSGTWACVVPNSGTWTVTATDGASTKAETVDITQEGQELSIELSYRFYLFMKGHGMQNGFNFEASLSSYTSADNNRITYNNNCQVWGAFQIKPNIDMSIYKSICFDVDVEATWQSGSYSLVYGVGAYVSGFSDEKQGTWAAKATSTVAGNPDRVVYRVDLSGVESAQYVKFVSRGTQGYVYNIWLE